MAIDPRAKKAFGSQAEEYERHRPGWPAEAVRRALGRLGLDAESEVIDLAAGTGKLTRELVPLVRRVIAVEPLADMRRALATAVPVAETLDGTAESIPLPDESVDGVFAAEAFHWFATGEAVAEIARVVRPGGGLALLWNSHDWVHEPWLAEMGELLNERRAPGVTPVNRKQTGRWKEAFDGSPFESLSQFEVRQEQRTDLGGLLAHISTWSFVGALEPVARE